MIIITPPAILTTTEEKWAWCVRWTELARRAHNWMGEWFNVGKTLVQYDAALTSVDNMLTRFIKTRFPYKYQLDEAEFRFFQYKFHQCMQGFWYQLEMYRPVQPDLTEAEREALSAEYNDALNNTIYDAMDGVLVES